MEVSNGKGDESTLIEEVEGLNAEEGDGDDLVEVNDQESEEAVFDG